MLLKKMVGVCNARVNAWVAPVSFKRLVQSHPVTKRYITRQHLNRLDVPLWWGDAFSFGVGGLFFFFSSFFFLSMLISMSTPLEFQRSSSICYSLKFDPYFFLLFILFEIIYKTRIRLLFILFEIILFQKLLFFEFTLIIFLIWDYFFDFILQN